MTNKLIEFVVLDDEQKPQLNAEGLPTLKQRPIAKDIGDLINSGKVENIEMFANLHAEVLQWNWAEQYLNYLADVKSVTALNENLAVIDKDEDGNDIFAEPFELPIEPERPPLLTATEVLAPFSNKIEKLRGTEFKGVRVSLNEANQNGLSALKSALDMAKDHDVVEQFFPINFNAETSGGVKVVELLDEGEFKQFGLQFIMARKVFFE